MLITARNEKEKQFIEALKTGDMISFKGVIKGESMRNLEIEPAILILDTANSETPAQPEPKQAVVTEQPSQVEVQAEQIQQSEPATTTTSQNKTWIGDWGNGIVAKVSSQPCGNIQLINQDYDYLMTVSIPVSRLKSPDDAWQVLDDRAITITGCWSKRDWNMIHAKLIRKKGNKTWEQDFK